MVSAMMRQTMPIVNMTVEIVVDPALTKNSVQNVCVSAALRVLKCLMLMLEMVFAMMK